MITLKNAKEIEIMREAGIISAKALEKAGRAVTPGITTKELDRIIAKEIKAHGAEASFLGYDGFPASACISINNEVIHGIPGKRVINEGDIVSIDVGAFWNGFHGDTAGTFAAGRISDEAKALMDATRESLEAAISIIKPGVRIGDISSCVQKYVEARGFDAVTKFVGHGIGRQLHEKPDVPNAGEPGRGARLLPGMTIALEPMINAKGSDVYILKDKWTVVTATGCLSAHYEHTLAVTENGVAVLTRL